MPPSSRKHEEAIHNVLDFLLLEFIGTSAVYWRLGWAAVAILVVAKLNQEDIDEIVKLRLRKFDIDSNDELCREVDQAVELAMRRLHG